MSHTHIHVHTRDYGTPEGAKKRITGGTHGEQGPDIKAGSNTRQPNPKPDSEPFRGYDTKECDCNTNDYGTSEGAKKRWSGSRAMNTPEAHAQRAANREKAENRQARAVSMARQGRQGSTARPNTPMSPRKQKLETERKAYTSSLPKSQPKGPGPDPFLRLRRG